MFETLPCSVSKRVHKGLMQELHCLQLPRWLQFAAPEGVSVLVYIFLFICFFKNWKDWAESLFTVHGTET